MAAAEVRVLGPIEVVGDDGPVALSAEKQRRLLAVLVAAAGRACSVDELLDGVWGAKPPASARKLLQVYVSQLRKALPPTIALTTRPDAYALELPAGAIDAERFERLLRESREARASGNAALAESLARRALALWRGRAFGEFALEEFARAEAERLEEQRLVAVEERLDAELALGRHAVVLGDALALVGDHPDRERLQELAMLALYRAGRQEDALAHYATVRRRLRDELGLEPGAALRELQARILRQDPSLAATVPEHVSADSLPVAPNRLVGRERELEELRPLLRSGDARLVVLTGAGGSGKTRLALAAARDAAPSLANGAVLVELAPLSDEALVLPAIGHAVGLKDVTAEAIDAVVAAVRDREMLLVLDNAEHVRAAAPRFVELLARSPRLRILVTSRAVLHVSGERVFPVAPLDEDAAVELFEQRARLMEPTFAVTPANADDVREICRRVDCLPLALELAAARTRALTPTALRERLADRLGLLTGGPRDLPARQQTLRETIAWSVDLLDDREREVFARLAALPGGATLDAAEGVCDATLETLEALVDHNLVRRLSAGADVRFDELETVREYALELLGAERPVVERALATYVADLLDRAVLKGSGLNEWLPRLDAEVDNVRTALDAAAQEEAPDLELRIAGRVWRYWWIRGAANEGLACLDRALGRSEGHATVERARALAGAAGLAWSARDNGRAEELATAAIPIAQATGGLYEESQAEVVLSIVANQRGEHAAARRHLERSIDLAEQLGVEPVTEKLNLGVIALDTGDYDGAASLFDEVLAVHRRDGNAEGVGFALLNLGLARYWLGDPGAARAAFDEAREAFDGLGFRAHVAHADQGIAATEVAHGRYREAAGLLGRAQAELEEVGYSEGDFSPELAAEAEAAVRDALGDEHFAAAFGAGRGEAAAERPNLSARD